MSYVIWVQRCSKSIIGLPATSVERDLQADQASLCSRSAFAISGGPRRIFEVSVTPYLFAGGQRLV